MGTQQILLIVLSVIIVGAAIAVGITMFNNQSYSANKSAIAADAQNFASQVVQYYKTPASQGGAGGDMSKMTAENIGTFIGWGAVENSTDPSTLTNENGTYIISEINTTDKTVKITGFGKEVKGGKKPKIVTTITFPEGEITAVASDVASTATT